MAVKAEPEWLMANQDFIGTLPDGNDFVGHKNVTRVRSFDQPARLWPKLFTPIQTTYAGIEAATAAPGEKRGA